jgi:uncharacterized phage-like protein YoqJ
MLLEQLRLLAPTEAISGMAQGVDQWAAACCSHLGIPWTAAVPFEGQEAAWPAEARAAYHKLLYKARDIVVVTKVWRDPVVALQARNEWMVDHADKVLAVWDGSQGGTANCVRFARLLDKPVVRICPKTWRITDG